MKIDKDIIIAFAIAGLSLILKSIYSKQPLLALIDVFFVLIIFFPFLSKRANATKYKIIFIIFSIISLFNEGILKNAGGSNWLNFLIDFFIKIVSGIFIFHYIKKNAKD